ncbi:thiolase domain-containing protein [Pararhodobacter zhoushanensis]|uniref:Thiolase domain-containing protein n=1 Tax=Pararhodobacter zhoushanensis TaxID=2479545 RepID=A0ABT3GW53_9RHOB|nr:thiolase domain-containing protein [Pararhodobacter zhoushanensis]MCW1931756.1 thiolase domain-containing protein [Pararhodobacter zhoushanensis]
MPIQTYITGTGHSRFGKLSATLEELITEVTREALADAGLQGSDIDAVYLGHFNSGLVPDGFASSLAMQADAGLRFAPATRCENACASGAAAFHGALNLIRAGGARNVLVIGAEKMTHRTTADVTRALAGAGYQNDPAEAGLSFPQAFALLAQGYGERYGDPTETLARIAVKNHANALNNPLAQMHKPLDLAVALTVSDRNPLIAPPLKLSDCSLITDGAAAVVLSSADAAASASRRVHIVAASHVSDLLPMAARDVLAFEGPRRAIEAAYAQAGITVQDLDFAEVHDCFTIAELLIYEAMGLAAPGQGGRVIADGTVLADGALPVNLSGGLKAKGHPVGATGVSMLALAARQLTGGAGAMQLTTPEWALAFNMGGAAVANYATVLHADRA